MCRDIHIQRYETQRDFTDEKKLLLMCFCENGLRFARLKETTQKMCLAEIIGINLKQIAAVAQSPKYSILWWVDCYEIRQCFAAQEEKIAGRKQEKLEEKFFLGH